jgi:hypothetical protein
MGGRENGIEIGDFGFLGVTGVRKAGGRTLVFCTEIVADSEVDPFSKSAFFFFALLAALADIDVASIETGDSGMGVDFPENCSALLAMAAALSKASFASRCRIRNISSSSALSLASITATLAETRC